MSPKEMQRLQHGSNISGKAATSAAQQQHQQWASSSNGISNIPLTSAQVQCSCCDSRIFVSLPQNPRFNSMVRLTKSLDIAIFNWYFRLSHKVHFVY